MKLSRFLTGISVDLCAAGRKRSSLKYRSAVRQVHLFSGDPDITLRQVFTVPFLCAFEGYLLGEASLCLNTSSSYLISLRAIFREAVERGKLPPQPGLFDHVFTGTVPTAKRAVPPGVIALVTSADLSRCSRLMVSRDMFVLSFHLHGISFIDLAHLSRADVKGDMVIYRRQKTGSAVVVPVNDVARELLNRYASRFPASPYALCLLDPNEDGVAVNYESVLRRHNRHLEELSTLLNLTVKLTTYVSRHSWASIAYHNNVEMPAISESLGHNTEKTTRVYLSSLAAAHLWRANRIVTDVVGRALDDLRAARTGRRKKIPLNQRRI